MPFDATPREAVRRTYVLDDFDLWDKGLHDAATDFHTTFGAYPTHVLAHPTAFSRFLAAADPENLRELDGAPLAADVDPDDGAIGVFETDDYTLEVIDDPSLFPRLFALLLLAPDLDLPTADTPPGSMLVGTSTRLHDPSASHPLHGRMIFKAEQCRACRHIVGIGTCAAFPDGIPLAIQQSRADHREPFEGDRGLRFQPTLDPRAPYDGPFFSHPGDAPFRYRRLDSPTDVPDPAVDAGWVGDTALAPELPPKDATVARVKALVRDTLDELGGPEVIEASPLSELLRARYPTTVAVADHQIRGGYQLWRVLVARCLAGRRTAARRRERHATSGWPPLPRA
ncbi:MAG: hypothetical protein H6745_05080 [Deltaproteobacteria bacterium]|nr:hypothetical protein [Deltaproteobacteria bacterium]